MPRAGGGLASVVVGRVSPYQPPPTHTPLPPSQGQEWLSDAAVSALAATAGSAIETLNLDGCGRVRDEGAMAIGSFCPNLVMLDLQNLPHLTDTGLTAGPAL